MRLILGVVNVAYSEGEGSVSTGDVAEWLEQDYHVMEIFAEEYRYRLGNWLAEGIADQIQDMANGAPAHVDPFQDGEQQIERAFRQFLAEGEIERINPETPTQAALEGRTKRRKSGKGPRRPSFIDTGLYQRSFRAWIEHDSASVAMPEESEMPMAAE
jgi:hypothetical protein